MDRSQHTYSSLDELRQIQHDLSQSNSLEELRQYFDRIQRLRRANLDDFEVQLFIADVQEEIIERARMLRGKAQFVQHDSDHSAEPVEIPPDVHPVDARTWQRATFLALFLTVIILSLVFYLIQTARRINLTPPETAGQQAQKGDNGKNAPAQNASNAQPAVSTNPTLRLYTDLIPGTVSVDEQAPKDLTDGELVLDSLQPGRHSIRVTGRNADAAFSFDVPEKSAPRVVGLPTASNVMAVLVSEEDGQARLVTNAEHSQILLDGKPAGEVGTDGLTIDNLGQTDHDLQVTQDKDRQRFVLTYTPAPALTVYLKSDPNAGTAIVVTGQDGVDVYVGDKLYRRKTDHGQVRVPLKVGEYEIRVHKAGFIDPPPQTVEVKKAEETAVEFRLQPVPEVATLQIKGALAGTMVFVDKDLAAAIGPDGNASISNVKPGDHMIELRRDQALPKRFQRSFHTGDVVMLSGPDVTLDRVVTDSKPAPPTPAASSEPAPGAAQNYGMEMEGEQVRKGGGFVPYHVPKVAGHYSFQAQGRIGGFLKRSKLQWYAGYQDSRDYILFVLDGKHAIVREFRDGKSTEVNKISFNADSSQWVQVELSVKSGSIGARIKTPDTGWSELGLVTSPGRDFTQDKVGFYIPGNDEIAVSNFKFSSH